MTWKKRIMSIALCLCALLCAASVRADAETAHTNHPVCGASHTDIGDHTDTCDDVTWTAWDGTDKDSDKRGLQLTAGHYYLSDNVTLSPTIEISGEVYLCLNGKTLKNNNGVSTVNVSGGKFFLCNCKSTGTITHDQNNNSRGVSVYQNGSFTMYGGSITDNYGGVEVYSGTFALYGGKITENEWASSNSDGGGGVSVGSGGKFFMYGGEISENKATTRGSGGVCNAGTFTMSGGSITNNTTKGDGGGVYNASTFNISGNITISGNKKIDSEDNETDNNVYLYLYRNTGAITIAGELTNKSSNNKIGVTTQTTFSDDNPCIDITKTNNNATWVNAAKSRLTYTDKNGVSHEIVTREGGTILAVCDHNSYKWVGGKDKHWEKCKNCDVVKTGTYDHVNFETWHAGTDGHYHECTTCGYKSAEAPHDWQAASCAAPRHCSICKAIDTTSPAIQHPICGLTCTHTDKHDPVSWTAWDGTGSIQYTDNVAYVSLSQDVTLTSFLTISANQKLYLCLNGHNLKMSGNRVINVEGGTFILCNCKDTGAITQANKNSKGMGVGLSNNGAFTMYGGSITGNKVGVSVGSGCTFTMYGGSITDNIAENYGAGVKNEGTFTMHGGEISKNKNTVSNGGGVFVGANATFTMSGGKIISNTAEGDGGGGVYNQGTFTMSDGEISGNTTTFGGGVRNYGTFTMSGGSITDNTAANNGGGVMGGLTVSGNVVIKDNKKGDASTGDPNNVYLYDNKTITLAGKLGENASIHVTTPSAPSSYIPITGGVAVANKSWADASKFTYDNSGTIKICTYTADGTVQLRACNHNYNNVKWTPNTDASTGHWRKCNNCDTIETVAHEYDQQNTANEYLKSVATCTAKAVYYKSCICGATDKNTAKTFESGETNPNNHTGQVGDWKTNADEHWKEYSCCQTKVQEAEHTWDSGTVNTPATCTTAGEKTFTCTGCGTTKTETIGAKGHDFTVRLYDETQHWYKCSRCDATNGESDHDLVHHDAQAPTLTAKGWEAYDTCTGCDYTTYKEIPATCSNHYWKLVSEVSPTCTTTGTQEHFECDNCENKSVTDGVYKIVSDTELILAIDPTNHAEDIDQQWLSDSENHWREYTCCHAEANKAAHSGGAATCTEQAVCGVCGTPYGAVLGHDWGAWVVTTPATKDAPGVETRTCTHDPAHTETRSIPRLSTAVYTVSEDTEIKQIEARVDGLDKILDSDENKQLANDGKSVGISLTVKNTASSGVSEKIKQKLAGNNLVGLRLELTVEKTVTENGAVVERENIPDTGVLLKTTITLPAELQGKSGYVVYRLHGDAVHVLTETPNANGEFITVSADKTQITICARLYSEYVIAYQTSGSSGGGYHPVNPTPAKATSANTGDAGVLLYGVTAALSLTGTAWLGAKGKKH